MSGDRVVFDAIMIVVHMKAKFDSESIDRRKKGMKLLDSWIDGQRAGSGDPDVIVLGDFNDHLDSKGSNNVFIPFTESGAGYTVLSQAEVNSGDETYLPYRSFIDHIIITNDALDEFGAGSAEVMHLEDEVSRYESRVSDHIPFTAIFRPN
ncbi:MAG: hypothetical protein R3A47_04975 [Polyangiales bacterium]